MKKWIFFFLSSIALSSFGQSKVNFEEYFLQNNQELLIQSFSKTVDIDLPTTKSSFSSSQAAVVIKDFFSKNIPTSYEVKHRGGGSERANFEIGILLTNKTYYRTYLLYELKGETIQIIELRIEPEE